MKYLFLLCFLPSLASAYRSGYVYEADELVGYTRLDVEPGRVYGRFHIYGDPRFDVISLERSGGKPSYEGTWRGIWTPREELPVVAYYLEWGGWQYWTWLIEGHVYTAVLGSDR
jgi:hypothetical protein